MEDEPDVNKDEIDEAELDMNKIEEDMHKVIIRAHLACFRSCWWWWWWLIIFLLKFEHDDDDEEENILNMEALSKMNNVKNLSKNIQDVKHEEIMESTTDATEWKLEVERVLPQLKVTIKTDHKVMKIFSLLNLFHNNVIILN